MDLHFILIVNSSLQSIIVIKDCRFWNVKRSARCELLYISCKEDTGLLLRLIIINLCLLHVICHLLQALNILCCMMCTYAHDHTSACNQSVAEILGDGVLLELLSLCPNLHQPPHFEHAFSAPTSTFFLYVNLYYYNDYTFL